MDRSIESAKATKTCRSGLAKLGKSCLVRALALCLPLAGCGNVESIYVLSAATASFINTDKLPTDMLAEAVTGLDCSTIRMINDKGPLCRRENPIVIERPLYCYRTLADIDCYVEPDPFNDGADIVG